MRGGLATRLTGVLLFLLMAACGGIQDDPILRLSAEESLARGKELMAAEKYNQARPYLTHAFEVEPNSVGGREALLLVADSLYLQGGTENYIKSEAKYRDFQNRFPTSDRSDYVQLQIANSLLQRMEKPDRDQSVTFKAMDAFQELLVLFPTSQYVDEARQQLAEVKRHLAEHEFTVGYFYLRFRLPPAAVSRFEHLLATYPDYQEKDKALYYLGLAYLRTSQPEKAADTFRQLREGYPESEYNRKISPQEAGT